MNTLWLTKQDYGSKDGKEKSRPQTFSPFIYNGGRNSHLRNGERCAERSLLRIQLVAPSYNIWTHLPPLARGSPGISGSPCSSITFVTGRAGLFSEWEVAREGTIVNGVGVRDLVSRAFCFASYFFLLSGPRETTCRFTPAIMFARLRTGAGRALIGPRAICRESSSRTRIPKNARRRRARLLRRWKRNVIAQANEQPWPRLQGRFDYYPAAVEDAAETHRSEAAFGASARNRWYSRFNIGVPYTPCFDYQNTDIYLRYLNTLYRHFRLNAAPELITRNVDCKKIHMIS